MLNICWVTTFSSVNGMPMCLPSINIFSEVYVLHWNHHYLRELVQDKEVKMEYVNTKEKIDDIFTKPLPKDAHAYLRDKLGVIPLSKAM